MPDSPTAKPPVPPHIEVVNRFNDRVDAVLAPILEQDPPGIVYHYTNVNGMIGIFVSNALWATASQYLNDTSELTYASRHVLDEVLDEVWSKAPPNVADLRKKLSEMRVAEYQNCYISCFCAKDDLLSQWRAYGGNQGYSIGFNGALLYADENNDDDSDEKITYRLRRVIYDHVEQKRLVSSVIETAFSFLEAARSRDPDIARLIVESCTEWLKIKLQNLFLSFKNPAFAVEHEWRLLRLGSPLVSEPVRHRAGVYGLTPYLELRPLDPSSGKLPVVSVTHGPTSDRNAAVRALYTFLHQHGYDALSYNVEVRSSALPVRL